MRLKYRPAWQGCQGRVGVICYAPTRHKMVCFAFFLVTAFLIFTMRSSVAAQEQDVVLMKGIRYSVFPFFAGDKIRVYTAVQNHSGYDIRGTLSFYDNNALITESPFSAVNGSIIEVWGDVEAKPGAHTLSVRITSVKKYEVGKDPKPIEIVNNTLETTFIVEIDTDQDRIANSADTDDDNDGISDENEIARRTNPLVPDTRILPKKSEIIGGNISQPVPTLSQTFIAPLENAIKTNSIPLVTTGAKTIQELVKANNNLTKGIANALQKEKNTIINEQEQAKTMSAIAPKNNELKKYIQTGYSFALTAALLLLKIWPLVLIALAYCVIAWKLRKRKW